MHPHTGMLGKFRVNLMCDQVQGGLALQEEGGQSSIGFVHPAARMKASGNQNPWNELYLAVFHSDAFKAIGHTATPELRFRTEPESQGTGTQRFPFPVGRQSTPLSKAADRFGG